MSKSPFLENRDHLFENEVGFVIFDKFPVTKGHCLIVPFRVYPNYFDSTENEIFFVSGRKVKNIFLAGFEGYKNIILFTCIFRAINTMRMRNLFLHSNSESNPIFLHKLVVRPSSHKSYIKWIVNCFGVNFLRI